MAQGPRSPRASDEGLSESARAQGKPSHVLVLCPHCGGQQLEPPTGVSTYCRACGEYFLVQDALHPPPKAQPPALPQKLVTCFDCCAEQPVPRSAVSTMCRKCGRHMDLADYRIDGAVSKTFRTHGALVVEPKAHVFGPETRVGEAVIKGEFLGRLTVERSLTIHSTANIKGNFEARHLIIPAGNAVGFKELIKVGSAEIAGELVADLHAAGTVALRSTARFFGHIMARSLVVEHGGVLSGALQVRQG